MKVEEQAGPDPQKPEVGDDLRFVHGQKPLDGLDLHDELALDEKIHAIAALEQHAFVTYRHRDLLLEAQLPQPELMGQTLFVRRLEEAWAELSVNLDTSADDQL